MNSEFILTKNRIISRIYDLFGALSTSLETCLNVAGPVWVAQISGSPKISRGEQHIGLPWVMLDYPRVFSRETGFLALRTFFWWGHYFTVQWVISGSHLKKINFFEKLREAPKEINGYQLYAGFARNPWDNDIPQEGLLLMGDLLDGENNYSGNVFKIGLKIPFEQWQQLPEITLELFKMIVEDK
jgi:hypothetical protein